MYKYTLAEVERNISDNMSLVSHGEWESWINHPCGLALKQILISNEIGAYEDWVDDVTTPEDARCLIRFIQTLKNIIFVEGLHTEVLANDEKES